MFTVYLAAKQHIFLSQTKKKSVNIKDEACKIKSNQSTESTGRCSCSKNSTCIIYYNSVVLLSWTMYVLQHIKY